jgi:hypothetical protein
MPGQDTYFVNCPHEGSLVEVVCPSPGRQVKKVTAAKSKFMRKISIGPYASYHPSFNKTTCPNCGEEIWIEWYFDD